MFGFDGDFRRRPIQSLGGASFVSDRQALLQKSAEERAKRNDMRQKNTAAIILESYVRSFLDRQRKKKEERLAYDDYWSKHSNDSLDDVKLGFLLRRLVFFYDFTMDSQRLIQICQQILRQPDRLLRNSINETVWMHRLGLLLNMCITQMDMLMFGQAIPLRMLETFTDKSFVERFIESEEGVQHYLERVFGFLIERDYFLRLRIQLERKCPPLDGETLHAPSPFTEAIFQLIIRPLNLCTQAKALGNQLSSASTVCESFATHILSLPYTEAIRCYLLPNLVEQQDFPFEQLLMTLKSLIHIHELEAMDLDGEDGGKVTFTGASSANETQKKPVAELKQNKQKRNIFSSFLMNSILVLDRNRLALLQSEHVFSTYISIIAHISPNILNLPKPIYKCEDHHRRNQEHESSDDEEDDDDDNEQSNVYARREANLNNTTADIETNKPVPLSNEEKTALLECIELLNDARRVQTIASHAEHIAKNEDVLRSICNICHNLMIYSKIAIFEYKLLYTLAFMPQFIRNVWSTLATQSSLLGFGAPLSLISKGVVPKEDGVKQAIPLLATFCMLFGRLLPTLHDAEFCDEKLLIEKPPQITTHIRLMPFSIAEIVQLSKTLKEISLGLVELAFPETRSSLNQHYRFVLGRTKSDDKKLKQKQIWSNLLKVVVFVLNQIHTRDLRLRFCPESHWIVSRLDLPLDRPMDLPLTRSSRTRGLRPFQPIRDFTREDYCNGPPMSTKQIRSITILREIPFVVSFSKRVGILQGLVAADKMRVQGNFQAFLQGPSIMITVRRSHLYEDAYDKLRPENEPDLRLKFRVQFVSSLGLDEAGIDGGGVFREFLSELIKTAFDPNRGFFMVTTDNKLYPNPNVADLVPEIFERHYYFIGRILGKAIYENLLVELPLAEFFLTKLAGKYADVDIHQLASLDPELYKNLLYLKDYEGDVSELGLDFTVTTSSFGQTQIVELKPNGQNIAVTASNRIEYLQLMADYKLNVQIKQHCTAFRRGLSNVLPVEWLYMFSNKELQILISGAEIPIDLEDLQKHCKYGGEYSAEHPAIITFWKTLEGFTDSQRRQLLKFVTSCSRPPLLGFKDLDPPFFIQNAGDMERLPTASTCTNLLKLPPFTSVAVMREKLLYAIQSGVGFELS